MFFQKSNAVGTLTKKLREPNRGQQLQRKSFATSSSLRSPLYNLVDLFLTQVVLYKI